jgi:hypothetical protein
MGPFSSAIEKKETEYPKRMSSPTYCMYVGWSELIRFTMYTTPQLIVSLVEKPAETQTSLTG